MWGLETFWRVRLVKKFDADILVFHEHWMGLLLTSPFLILGARALRGVSRKALVSMLASGVLGSALGTVCFTEALTLLNSSLANLLLNVQPIISVLVSWFWLRERPRPSFYPWATVALACGVAMAWSPDAVRSPHRLALGLLFIGATAFCWGASTTFGRAAMIEIDFKTGTALRYLIGTFATFALAALGGNVSGRLQWQVLWAPSTLKDVVGLLVVAAITPTFLYFAWTREDLELRSQHSGRRWRRPLRRSSSPGACWETHSHRGRSRPASSCYSLSSSSIVLWRLVLWRHGAHPLELDTVLRAVLPPSPPEPGRGDGRHRRDGERDHDAESDRGRRRHSRGQSLATGLLDDLASRLAHRALIVGSARPVRKSHRLAN